MFEIGSALIDRWGEPTTHLLTIASSPPWAGLQNTTDAIVRGVLASAAVTIGLLPRLIKELHNRTVIDQPVARSSHETPTPRGGGLAPAAGAIVGLVVAFGLSTSSVIVVAVVAAAFGSLGLIDDLSSLSAGRRLVIQIAIAAAGVVPLSSGLATGLAFAILGVVGSIWLVGFVNAFNFMDGINGISAIQVIVAGAAWGIVGTWKADDVLTGGGLIVAAAGLGFLPFNFPRARVFLGDVGSYFFGGWLAALSLVGLDRHATFEMAVAPLLLYVCDTGTTLIRRVTRGERWTEPHREHVYQRLVINGWSHAGASGFVGLVIAVSSLLGALTMLGHAAGRMIADVALVLLMLAYLKTPAWQARRRP